MDRNEQLRFELVVLDLLEDYSIVNVEKLEKIASQLHECVENAIFDYCEDNNIEGYTPSC